MATIEMPAIVGAEIEAKAESRPQAEIKDERPSRWLWTRKDYYKASEIGLFHPDERLELIEGEILRKMSPQSRPHAFAIGRAAETMRRAFPNGFRISEEKPMVLNDLTEPEPDIVVARGTWEESPDHPTPANTVLVIEVSSSTLTFDQTEKAAAYARSGIADYWILNLRARQLEVRRDPGPMNSGEHGYCSLQIILEDGEVSPLAASDITVRVSDLLPSLPLTGDSSEEG